MAEDAEPLTLEILDGPFKIANRGDLWVVKAPYEMSRDHPEIVGREFSIAGERRIVLGVERFLPATPIRKGESIGVLFKPPA